MKALFSIYSHKRPSASLFRRKLFFSDQSWLSEQGNPLIKWPAPPLTSTSSSSPNHYTVICSLFTDPAIASAYALESALERAGVHPTPDLIQSIFDRFDSSPKLLHTLFLWAEKKPGFQSSPVLFNSMVNFLAKSKEFEDAWCLVLDRIGDGDSLVSLDTFTILIRRYARAGMPQPAIRTFEFASSLKQVYNSNQETALLEILLDSLCKEGNVRAATEYFDRRKELDGSWIPTIRIYNILLNGWFRSRKLKHGERLWMEMRKEGVLPTVVTYGTLVEGYCRMRRVERAIELVDEMKSVGLQPNSMIFNPIIDALGEAGRFKEALGMIERLSVCESGPTISTYNSLVKGYCKKADLVGASKTIKMMISRGFIPTPTTYNYFFRYFSKFRKIEEGMNLYTKMIESGYNPDRLTYHLLLKMLCEEERLELAVQVSKEMRARGYDMDLAAGTMLIHLLCKMHRFEEAIREFEDMIRRGIVPQYLTFQRINHELKKRGLTEMSRKLYDAMSSVPHSSNLPNTYEPNKGGASHVRRTSIMRKAEAMSDILKTCKNPRELANYRSSSESAVSIASRLVENIKKRVKET
ncbi:hypothetical protein SLE2022_358670 [Rubroshorea leprosula]